MATESESGDSAEITYTYDAAGNRTGKEVFKSGATGSMTFESSYTYNEFNQLTGSVEESREDYIRTAYTYDTNGNQISKTTTDAYTNTQTGQTVYTYDAANRIKTATGTTGGAVDYVQENKYNGFGKADSHRCHTPMTSTERQLNIRRMKRRRFITRYATRREYMMRQRDYTTLMPDTIALKQGCS